LESLVERLEVIGFNFDIVIDEMNDVFVDFGQRNVPLNC